MQKRKKDSKTVEYFTLRRSLVAGMTAESWEKTPHAGGYYEPDITDFWDTYQRLRGSDPRWTGITANTLLLYVVVQGILACPCLNGYVYHQRKMATGRTEFFENINITMPMILPGGGMMAVNVHNCERLSLRQLGAAVGDFRRRLDNTILERPMFGASLDDTMRRLKRGRVDILLMRVIGHSLGSGRMPLLWGKARKAYRAIPKEDRLTTRDIEAGTIMVTNFGSVYRGAYAPPAMINLIPPQICAIGIGGVAERPGTAAKPDGAKEIALRKFLPIQVIFDHRAIDYGDTVPFMKRLDEIFANPEDMAGWI